MSQATNHLESDDAAPADPYHLVHRGEHGILETDCCDASIVMAGDETPRAECAACGTTIAEGAGAVLALCQ